MPVETSVVAFSSSIGAPEVSSSVRDPPSFTSWLEVPGGVSVFTA